MAASFSIKLLFLICALASKISLLSFSLQKSNIHQTSSPLRRFSYFHSSQTKEIKCEISILYDGKSEGDVVSPPRSFYDTTTTPTITALIGCTAFLFQIFGIFPWHEKLQTAYESVAVRCLLHLMCHHIFNLCFLC
jgi:hypothetical protein